MTEITYEYSEEQSGRYDKPVYHCVTKRKNGVFEWSWSLSSKDSAERFMKDNAGKDTPYPGGKR